MSGGAGAPCAWQASRTDGPNRLRGQDLSVDHEPAAVGSSAP